MKIGQIRKVIDVSADDISDILVGAFEGGKNYPFKSTQPDAYTYDTILQNALFKEVVYG